jgi:hypothetical protein
MAKQTGDIKIEGTVDEICFYQMLGEHYARRKSSLTKERFWQDTVFEGSRRSCERMGRASSFASKLYRSLEKERKSRELFRAIAGRVKLQLQEGWEEVRIEAWFRETYFSCEVKPNGNNSTTRKHKPLRAKAPVVPFQARLFVIPSCNSSKKKIRLAAMKRRLVGGGTPTRAIEIASLNLRVSPEGHSHRHLRRPQADVESSFLKGPLQGRCARCARDGPPPCVPPPERWNQHTDTGLSSHSIRLLYCPRPMRFLSLFDPTPGGFYYHLFRWATLHWRDAKWRTCHPPQVV